MKNPNKFDITVSAVDLKSYMDIVNGIMPDICIVGSVINSIADINKLDTVWGSENKKICEYMICVKNTSLRKVISRYSVSRYLISSYSIHLFVNVLSYLSADVKSYVKFAKMEHAIFASNHAMSEYKKKNYDSARRMFGIASSQGCGKSMYYLGLMNRYGEGSEVDEVLAGKCFRSSEKMGYIHT